MFVIVVVVVIVIIIIVVLLLSSSSLLFLLTLSFAMCICMVIYLFNYCLFIYHDDDDEEEGLRAMKESQRESESREKAGRRVRGYITHSRVQTKMLGILGNTKRTCYKGGVKGGVGGRGREVGGSRWVGGVRGVGACPRRHRTRSEIFVRVKAALAVAPSFPSLLRPFPLFHVFLNNWFILGGVYVVVILVVVIIFPIIIDIDVHTTAATITLIICIIMNC